MCRLLGWASRTPVTLADLLGEIELDEFTELSCKHGDGWGVARATGGGVEVEKAPDAARRSPDFSRIARTRAADLAMVHLRWATLGLPVTPENAHPFTNGQLAFAHNGSVAPPAVLESLISDRVLPLLHGNTDSELLFLAILSRLGEGRAGGEDAVAQAYASVVRDVADTLPHTSLNSILLTPTHLYAVCCYDVAAEAQENEHEYYRLRYRVTSDAAVVSSSGWGQGWADLPNRHMLVLEGGSLTTTVCPMSDVIRAS